MAIRAVLFDLDGTLVDSNDYHVRVWAEVFRDAGTPVTDAAIHEQIGKGTDMLVPALFPGIDEAEVERLGKAHAAAFKERFLMDVRPFPGAHQLLARVRGSGRRAVLASSASKGDVSHYLDLLDAGEIVAASTSSDDVEHTKPAPDIFSSALDKVDLTGDEAMVIGDSPFDMEAAARCGIRAIALRSGGFTDAVLQGAGAVAIYDDVASLLADFDASPIVR